MSTSFTSNVSSVTEIKLWENDWQPQAGGHTSLIICLFKQSINKLLMNIILSSGSSVMNTPHFLWKAAAEQFETNSLCHLLLVCSSHSSADVHGCVCVRARTHTLSIGMVHHLLKFLHKAGNSNLHGNQRANAEKMFFVGANVCKYVGFSL